VLCKPVSAVASHALQGALQAGIGGCITCASSRQNRLCDLLGPAFSSGTDATPYRAKTNGRDRVEASDEAVPGAPERRGQGAMQNPQGAILQPVPKLAVPLVGSFRAAAERRAPLLKSH
jgi:hypothetical protein